MPVIKDTELVKEIKNDKYFNVYYFYGKDVMTIEKYTKHLCERLLEKSEDTYNFHKYNGKELDLSNLSETAEALPMFSKKACITINDLNGEELSQPDLNYLLEIISNLPETTVIIIYITGFDVCGGKKFPTTKNKKIIDAVSKYGVVCELNYKRPDELAKPIITAVEKEGCEISRINAEYLASQCLCNMVLISNELNKLTSYTGMGEITKEAIDLLVAKQLDSNAFLLAKAVTQFESRRALLLLDELFTQRAEPVAVVSAIGMSFIDLYRARCAINNNKSVSDVIVDFDYSQNRKFAVENAFRDAKKLSIEQLRYCIEVITQTDIKLKSSKTDGRLLIEEAIIKMASKRR